MFCHNVCSINVINWFLYIQVFSLTTFKLFCVFNLFWDFAQTLKPNNQTRMAKISFAVFQQGCSITVLGPGVLLKSFCSKTVIAICKVCWSSLMWTVQPCLFNVTVCFMIITYGNKCINSCMLFVLRVFVTYQNNVNCKHYRYICTPPFLYCIYLS